jgi:hypothetical protein
VSKLAPDLAVISLPSLVAAMPRNYTGVTVLLRWLGRVDGKRQTDADHPAGARDLLTVEI